MKRLFVVVGVVAPLMVAAGCGSKSSGSGTGGHGGTGAGGAGTGGQVDGGAPDSAPGDAVTGGSGGLAGTAGAGGGAGAAGAGGSAGGGGGGTTPTLAQLCAPATGAGGAAGGGGGAGGATAGLVFVNQTYAADGRVVPSEAVFSFINTIDDPHPQTLRLHNGGTAAVQITSLQIVGNTTAPGTNAPATPGPAGGTLFPLTYNQVSLTAAFKITPSMTIPATLAAGADLDVAVQFLSTKTNPPDRMLNIGGQAVSAVLVAEADGRCVPAGLYAVSLWNNSETAPDATTGLPSNNWARYEPTFGQIVATLGYKVNLGSAFIQLLNTNDMSIPSVGLSTEEVQVHKFVKADATAPVQLFSVGRFSPPTDIPYGWYPVGSLTGAPATGGAGGAGGVGGTGGAGGAAGPTVIVTDAQPAAIPSGSTQVATQPAPLRVVATMLASPLGVEWNTSNYSEQVLPPLIAGSAGTTFDPGATIAFGIWAFTNQRTVGGLTSAGVAAPNTGNGDYVYSEDALNIDGVHSHRLRVYPLKNRAGALVPNSYLLGWEEATNGDYQDYVFVLKNVSPAP